MARSWSDFLQGPTPSAHAVQVYGDLGELAESVASYLAAGFETGQPALIVVTPGHRTLFSERLADAGWDAQRIERDRLLAVADAEETLATFMVSDSPSAAGFDRTVGGLLDEVEARAPGRPVRVFGEMVDLLCERGRSAAAVAVEELWNSLARRRRFSLLCGYRLDVFDRASQVWPLPVVCRLHSHVQPAHDVERLTLAVDRALEEVLGAAEARRVHLMAGEQPREDKIPKAQLALMWVSANMPVLADRVLAAAQAHYFDAPPAAAVA